MGATLYTLLTGQTPVESIARVKGRTLLNPGQLNPRLSPTTEDAILKALALHPEGRFQSAAEFRLSLSLEGRGAGVRVEVAGVRISPTFLVTPPDEVMVKSLTEPTSPPPTTSQPRPTWILPVGVGLTVVACLFGLVWFLLTFRSPASTTQPAVEATFTALAAIETQAPGQPTAAVAQAFFTPTVHLIPATPVPELRVDEKGVAMALVPAGEFLMGNEAGDSLMECKKFRSDCQRIWFFDEEPVHGVYLDSFYIYLFEVTNALNAKCVAADVCSKPQDTAHYPDSSYSQHPVAQVDWSQARQYCQWRGGDLPTEAQWEKAARGGLQEKFYPWGDEAPVCTGGVENGAQSTRCEGQLVEVGSFSPNGYGLYDMAGNVWEWVLDWYLENFYVSLPSENPSGPDSGKYRILRGGSWDESENSMRVANRYYYYPHTRSGNIGFRCAFSP